MRNRYFIILTLFCMVFPVKTVAGTAPAGSSDVPARRFAQNVPSARSAGKYSAQDDKKVSPGGNAGGDTAKARETAADPEVETRAKKAPEKAKQIKPFVPSEKIPADQGVDFPYDI